MRKILLGALLFSLVSCAGENFDVAAYPANQKSVMMAFKRLADHGRMEPVLEEGQSIDAWQFYVHSRQTVSLPESDEVTTIELTDGSGIVYNLTSATSPIVDDLELGAYGFGTGRVTGVQRDLAAGQIEAEVLLSRWEPRDR